MTLLQIPVPCGLALPNTIVCMRSHHHLDVGCLGFGMGGPSGGPMSGKHHGETRPAAAGGANGQVLEAEA